VFALVVVVDILLEHPGLYMNLFFYYGHQPFWFTRFPLWWGAVNATIPIVSVTLVYLLRPHLRGWRILAVVPLIPVVQAGVSAAVSWPVWNTINTSLPAAVVWVAGALTIGLCACLVAICAETLARESARRAVAAPRESERASTLAGLSAS
jgi:hypothetical protein